MEAEASRLSHIVETGDTEAIRTALLQQGLTSLEEDECIHAAVYRDDPTVWAALLQCGINPDHIAHFIERLTVDADKRVARLRELAPSLQRAGLTPAGLDHLRELMGDASAWKGRRRDVLMFRQVARGPGPALTWGSMEHRFGTLATFRTLVEQDDADGVAAFIQEDRVPPAAVTSAAYRAAATGKVGVLTAVLARDPPRVGWVVAEGLFQAVQNVTDEEAFLADLTEAVAPRVSPAAARDMLHALFYTVHDGIVYVDKLSLLQQVLRACGVVPHSDFFRAFALTATVDSALTALTHDAPQTPYAQAAALQHYAADEHLNDLVDAGLDIGRYGGPAVATLLRGHAYHQELGLALLKSGAVKNGLHAAYDILLDTSNYRAVRALESQSVQSLLPEDSPLRNAIEAVDVDTVRELLDAGVCVRGPGPELTVALDSMMRSVGFPAGPGANMQVAERQRVRNAVQAADEANPGRIIVNMLLDAGASMEMHEDAWILKYDSDIATRIMQRGDAVYPHRIVEQAVDVLGMEHGYDLEEELLHFGLHEARAPAPREEQCREHAAQTGGAKRPRAPDGAPGQGDAKRRPGAGAAATGAG